jgi:hypothetical protein
VQEAEVEEAALEVPREGQEASCLNVGRRQSRIRLLE